MDRSPHYIGRDPVASRRRLVLATRSAGSGPLWLLKTPDAPESAAKNPEACSCGMHAQTAARDRQRRTQPPTVGAASGDVIKVFPLSATVSPACVSAILRDAHPWATAGEVVRTTLPRTLHLVARNLGDFALSFAVLPLPLSPEAPHRSLLVRERRRQHRATLEHEAHACCCARVDRPVLVVAAYVQTFGIGQ